MIEKKVKRRAVIKKRGGHRVPFLAHERATYRELY